MDNIPIEKMNEKLFDLEIKEAVEKYLEALIGDKDE
tara:strand:- start:201 stop:308 length:108 start_codon:yes stop_codon:yes gene_type:complete